jgi:hypothetical protein
MSMMGWVMSVVIGSVDECVSVRNEIPVCPLDQSDLIIAFPDLEPINECVAKVVPEFFCAIHRAADTSAYFLDRLSDQVGARHPTLVTNGDAGYQQVVCLDAKIWVALPALPKLTALFVWPILNQRVKIFVFQKVTYPEACEGLREI